MSAKVEGLSNVLQNIRNITPIEAAKMNAKLSIAGNVLESGVKEHASLTDHTLKDLADMGHPYSKRYGVDSGPHSDDIVHRQSGLLFDNIEKHENLNMIHSTVEVGVDESKVPYIGDLIAGNGRQRPRNFLGGAYKDKVDEVIAITQGR
ncbi:MAG: hypothetical protein K0Q53_76 [Massilibacillus sp.]|jgi:hypothetical protein|nr:hypothetical protein [Massilibacillus sp.]